MIVLLALSAFGGAPIVFPGSDPLLDPAGEALVRQGLAVLLVDEQDLAWNKDYVNGEGILRDRWRVPGIEEALSEPLSVPVEARHFTAHLEEARGPAALITAGARVLGHRLGEPHVVVPEPAARVWPRRYREIEELARYAAAKAADTRGHVEVALSGVPVEVVDRALAAFDPKSEETWEVTKAAIEAELAASDAVDWVGLFTAARNAAQLAEEIRHRAYGIPDAGWPKEVLILEEGGMTVVIGTLGRDRLVGDVVIDPGGDDSLSPRMVGVDMGGDDRWSAGSAKRGVVVLIDDSGDDIWESGDIGPGGALFGVGVAVDEHGRDVYDGGILCQGAAAHGIGVLSDLRGDDRYEAVAFSQGFGGVRGYGAVVDWLGDDSWRAGGKIPSNAAYPDRTLSMSQGFAYGHRPIAGGGVGILYDRDGDDVYVADTFAQGGSYWFGRGYLVDLYGNDAYTATQYAQGSAVHLSVAGLFDLEGDDIRSGYGLGMGAAHDYSVGWLVDRAGNDFTVSASSGSGMGITNSAGFAVDQGGDDRILLAEPLNLGNWTRNQGAFSLRIDGGGTDTRDAVAGIGEAAVTRPWMFGAQIDVGPALVLPAAPKPVDVKLAYLAPLEAAVREVPAEALARIVAVCGGGEGQQAAREAVVAGGAPAFGMLLPALPRGSFMDGWCLDEVFQAVRAGGATDEALRAVLLDATKGVLATREERWIVGWLAAVGKSPASYEAIARQATSPDPNVRQQVAAVLPTLGQGDPDGVLARLGTDRIEAVRATAAWALGEIGADPAAIVPLLSDPCFLVRFNAAAALEASKDPQKARALVREAWDRGGFDRDVIRHLHLVVLGRLGDRALLVQIAASDADPWAQWHAKQLLAGEAPPWRR